MNTVPTPPTHTQTAAPLAVDGPAFATLAESLLRSGTSLRFRAAGGSMRPWVRDGDVLTVVPVRGDEQRRRGEILLCRVPGGGVVAHRFLGWRQTADGPRARLRGDASCAPPDLIAPPAVLGRVTIRTRGAHVLNLNHPWWRACGRLHAGHQSLRRLWHDHRATEPRFGS